MTQNYHLIPHTVLPSGGCHWRLDTPGGCSLEEDQCSPGGKCPSVSHGGKEVTLHACYYSVGEGGHHYGGLAGRTGSERKGLEEDK